MPQPSIMFVAREIKQTLLRKFSKVFSDSPFILASNKYFVDKSQPELYFTDLVLQRNLSEGFEIYF